MIEIEKKFILTGAQETQLLQNATFVKEKTFTDTYYDDQNHSLTIKDLWLRERDGNFELKVPMNASLEERVSDQYREIEEDDEIADFLQINISNTTLRDALKERGIIPFCTLVTTRKKYTKDGFGIDLDKVDFGFNIAEIELMIESESEITQATEKIIAYAKSYGLSIGNIRGKVAEYLSRYNQPHLDALIAAKVIK